MMLLMRLLEEDMGAYHQAQRNLRSPFGIEHEYRRGPTWLTRRKRRDCVSNRPLVHHLDSKLRDALCDVILLSRLPRSHWTTLYEEGTANPILVAFRYQRY